MRTFLLVLLAASASAQTTLYPGVVGQELLNAIDRDYSPSQTLEYGPARDAYYAREQATYGELCGVYTQFCVTLNPAADPSSDAFNKGINAEHTWPQSFGAGAEPARSDLHNLFPSKSNVNSSRGNLPFGEIPDSQTTSWFRQSAQQSFIPSASIDEWSERRTGMFEPREDHKGNAARAVFYFAAVWQERVTSSGDAFLAGMLDDLLGWVDLDPVDDRERSRSTWIASRQGTENPFILDPTLARRAFAPQTVDVEAGPDGALEVTIGPNPVRGVLTVRAEGLQRIEIIDALGRRVAEADGERLDLGQLAGGVYVARVTTRAGVATRAFTVAR